MNEENNLNTVPQTNPEPVTPVEPVQQPVQPTVPVQQPVAPVQPTAPVTPAPQVDAEAIMEQKVVEMEQKMMKEKIEPPVEQHEEVTTEEVAKPVEPQIDPSFGTNVQPPIQPVPEPTKKKSKLPVILIVLVILAAGGFACWKFVLPMLNKETKVEETTTTTTTTTTKKVELLEFKTMDDYITYASDNQAKVKDLYLISIDDNIFNVNYDLDGKCKNVDDKVSFEVNGLKIEYTCEGTSLLDDSELTEWKATVTVNDKYKLDKTTATTCTNWHHYSNSKYYMNVTAGCGMDAPIKLEIESENNEKIYVGEIISQYVKTISPDTQLEYKNTQPISKDNVIYFITQESVNPETTNEYQQTTCSIKYIDFNSDKPEVKDMGVTDTCYDITEYKIED